VAQVEILDHFGAGVAIGTMGACSMGVAVGSAKQLEEVEMDTNEIRLKFEFVREQYEQLVVQMDEEIELVYAGTRTSYQDEDATWVASVYHRRQDLLLGSVGLSKKELEQMWRAK
jgi:hypothetical protein